MQYVSDILKQKGGATVTVAPATPVIEALALMAEKNIGSVVVMDQGNYMGILTERDYSRKVILMGRNSQETQVHDIMGTQLPALAPSDTIAHCMLLMRDQHLRYLPVFNAGQLAGIISMSDVVSATITQQRETISHLENYIAGS